MAPSSIASEKVVVKKVPAFPISAQLTVGAVVATVQVLRLNTRGLMAQVGIGSLKMGDKCGISFELPVLHYPVTEQMVVIKQYNHWQGNSRPVAPAAGKPGEIPPDLSVGHLVEMHFVSLSSQSQERIATFLRAAHITE